MSAARHFCARICLSNSVITISVFQKGFTIESLFRTPKTVIFEEIFFRGVEIAIKIGIIVFQIPPEYLVFEKYVPVLVKLVKN